MAGESQFVWPNKSSPPSTEHKEKGGEWIQRGKDIQPPHPEIHCCREETFLESATM